jgi:Ca2+-binding RTX toxin-like protein
MPRLKQNTDIAASAVYRALGERAYTGTSGDYLEVSDRASLSAKSSTVSLSFSLDRLPGEYSLVSKDGRGNGAGEFTLWLKDGTIVVTQENGSETEWLKVPDVVLEANTTYQLALSMGRDGLQLWLNGALVAAEPEFAQGMDGNSHPMVIGGSRAWRDNDTDSVHSLFKGMIGDVMVFDRQLDGADMIALAAAVDLKLAMPAQMAAELAALSPVFEQAHHGSDLLKDILHDYGFGHGSGDGGMDMGGMGGMAMGGMDGMGGHAMGTPALAMQVKGNGDHEIKGTKGADGLDGGGGDDIIKGGGGGDVLQGGYGNDRIKGGGGHDILDGGHGEDRLNGGGGNDLLIARADGREGAIFFDPDRDEGDPDGELTNGKLYPDQPIPADDVLTGGKGADIFYFQTLINAKKRYIEKHTRDDGSINWHGVAGENDKLHDHWVDVIGNDVVMDYSRAEGDRIVIEGHTTEILSISHGDANGDGVMDHSVNRLYSEQGNGGGAHADDRLGTITVYGDLVKESDIEADAGPAYGIVAGIDALDEALAPADMGTNTAKAKPPAKGMPTQADLGLPAGLAPVMAVAGTHDFSAEDRSPLIFDHGETLELKSGTIAFSFKADETNVFQALFSKDASGEAPGHITAYVNEIGSLVLRVQDASESYYLEVDHIIKAGKAYDFAATFGSDGVALHLNGARVAYDSDIKVDLSGNAEALIVGATGWSSTPGMFDKVYNDFNGSITNFMVFDEELTGDEIFGDAPRDDFAYFGSAVARYDFARSNGSLVIKGPGDDDAKLAPDSQIEFLKFADAVIRSDEIQFGSALNDVMSGRDGADVLLGGVGDDELFGADNDDLLRGGDGADKLVGGDGADRLEGDAGDDRLFGGDGGDLLFGGDGHDAIYGEGGNDRIYGGLGDDRIYGHLWNDDGTASNDRVYFDGNFKDYTFESSSWKDDSRGGDTVWQLTVTDSANGGADGYYEGSDRLIDVDWLVFADRSVAFGDLL